jgi:hypothetical protein
MKKTILAGLLALMLIIAGIWLYGEGKYQSGIETANRLNEQARIEYEGIANAKIDEANRKSLEQASRTKHYAGMVDVLERDIGNRNATITGLLNSINHAKPRQANAGVDDSETDWRDLFSSCRARAESLSIGLGELGGEAAILADQVNGLIDYVSATSKD